MPPSKARKGRNRVDKELKAQGFLNLCTILAQDEKLLSLISECKDFATLNAYVFTKAQGTTYQKHLSETNASARVKSVIVTYRQCQLPLPIQNLQRAFRQHVSTRSESQVHRRKNRTAKRIGFLAPSNTTTAFLPKITLKRLSAPYPVLNAYVLERSSPVPDPLKVTDITCGKCNIFIPIDGSQLQYTLKASESAIFVNEQDEIIAVVIRDFACDYYDIIKPWAEDLINDSIKRRTLSQRNGPGKLARVGVTDGPRNARVFGWSRSLKKKFKKAWRKDHDEHERNISALFGLFYSLLRAQAPTAIIDDLENAMTAAGLPRLDFDKEMKFPLPFLTEEPVTFTGYPLSPPEGYIARNFAKQIHIDKHWTKCPWGAYWNIKRCTAAAGDADMEYGANFFIPEYGLRIVNSANVCVIWDVSLPHGTSWYYDGLEQVGIAFVLSPSTQNAWQGYQDRVDKGEIEDGFTIIEDAVEH